MGFQQGFRINTNTSSLDTYRNYSASQAGMERNIERLSSGLRINNAADDSAGLSISNRMNNQVRGMQQANRNVQQGNNMLQTAEGAMNEISNILGRMRELAVQGASDGVNTDDRASIKLEMDQLSSEITRIADSTEYNDTKVIDGSLYGNVVDSDHANNDLTSTLTGVGAVAINQGDRNTIEGTYTLKFFSADGASERITNGTLVATDYVQVSDGTTTYQKTLDADDLSTGNIKNATVLEFGDSGIKVTADADINVADIKDKRVVVETGDGATLQVGADNDSNNQVGFSLKGQTSSHLGIDSMTLSSGADFQGAIDKLDLAIAQINDERGNIGAKQNRLEYTSSNLMNSVQNNAASMSTIRDADFAAEAADLAKNQILVQSGTAMLAQANGLSQNVLALIR